MTRLLSLCADDYGAGAAIDHGIRQLAALGRLSAVSCLVNTPGWALAAPQLQQLDMVERDRVRLGLHFNLTEGAALTPALRQVWPQLPRLPELIARAHLRALPLALLRDELRAQLEAFVRHAGTTPAHIDGHQHIHHLPGLRELLLAELPAWPRLRVRNTAQVAGPGHGFKRWLIRHTGGQALGRALPPGRQTNRLLLGVYDFQQRPYRRLMQAWLQQLPERGGLVFCHPADGKPAADDPIAPARQREFDYFASDAFVDDLAEFDVKLRAAPQNSSAG
jgi:predicted glycoside hydrolase/deacetylase ChbG (UPF0249 family)